MSKWEEEPDTKKSFEMFKEDWLLNCGDYMESSDSTQIKSVDTDDTDDPVKRVMEGPKLVQCLDLSTPEDADCKKLSLDFW